MNTTIRKGGCNWFGLFLGGTVLLGSNLLPGRLAAQSVDPAQLATTVDDGFTIAVVGDIIISYPLDHMLNDPGFRAVVELTQGADVTTGNLEGNIIDGRSFKGSAGGGFGGEPEVAEWIKQMGFDIVSRPWAPLINGI